MTEVKKHNCQEWHEEGMGCMKCGYTDRRKLELWDDFIFYVRSRPCNCKFFLEHNCDRCKLLAKAAELDKQ